MKSFIPFAPKPCVVLFPFRIPVVGTFAVAWVMTKFTEPLRLATTVVIVPPIARYWDKLMASKAGDDAE